MSKICKIAEKKETYGDNKRVRNASGGVGQLICKLNVVLIEPATVDHGDAVESCYASLSEDSGKEVTNDASNSMTGEDLKIDVQLFDS